MINFERFELPNGLKVLVHQDFTTPIVAMSVLYDVGARDEDPNRTGFAHLFEHLMFGGSVNIPRYDEPLEKVGGENNAFTSNDITCYHLSVPKPNIETAFWLESDRMMGLAFSAKSLKVQKNVVKEEFRQTHLNQPYGDAWLLLRPLAYKVHPYRWSTIGADINHIESAAMSDVKDFFRRFYHPSNAILTLAGPVTIEEIKELCKKWFGDIPARVKPLRTLPQEPVQAEARLLEVEKPVPHHAIYKAWHIGQRLNHDYYTADLTSDILSAGDSARLYVSLVKKRRLFSDINAFITGSNDPGLFVVSGKVMEGVNMTQANSAIEEEVAKLTYHLCEPREIQKVKNRVESLLLFSEIKVVEKAINISHFELLGDASMINRELERYCEVTPDTIHDFAKRTFRSENCSTLYYYAKNLRYDN
ncbi:MAG TPA: pitrilysin family protein [Bacteroidales bacterium]|nr:pitrilysin family protein [Bacteroidales bacterium]